MSKDTSLAFRDEFTQYCNAHIDDDKERHVESHVAFVEELVNANASENSGSEEDSEIDEDEKYLQTLMTFLKLVCYLLIIWDAV